VLQRRPLKMTLFREPVGELRMFYPTMCSSQGEDSNGRLDGEIGGVDGDATPSLAESIGKFSVHISSGRCSKRPLMVGMYRGERGLSIGIGIMKIGRFDKFTVLILNDELEMQPPILPVRLANFWSIYRLGATLMG